MTTRAYSQTTLDQMRADLRVMDAEVLHLESLTRSDDPEDRAFAKKYLKHSMRQQRALAAKVARITGREQGS